MMMMMMMIIIIMSCLLLKNAEFLNANPGLMVQKITTRPKEFPGKIDCCLVDIEAVINGALSLVLLAAASVLAASESENTAV